VVPGDILLLDDGRVQLKVLEVQGMKVFTEVTVGGPLSNNKGINKLGGGLSAEALTEKDKATSSPPPKLASITWPSPSRAAAKT
jgi:pyruvate kinase